MKPKRIIVAMTGASGSVYCKRLIHVLSTSDAAETHLISSKTGLRVAAHELQTPLKDIHAAGAAFSADGGAVTCHGDDFFAPIASGSFRFDAMVVIPCSGGRLGSFSAGVSSDLIDRAVEVTLKESRRLIVVPRETPLSRIHLDNLSKLSAAGAIILPAMPGFYHRPQSVEDMVDSVIQRVLDHLDIEMDLSPRWKDDA